MALFNRGGHKKRKAKKGVVTKKSTQFSGLSIGKILWAGFLVIAIITLLSAYSSYLLYADRIDENHSDQQQAIAERAAAVFSAKLSMLTASINRAINDPAIQSELNKIPVEQITPPKALQKRLKEQLQLLIRQVIIGPGTLPNDDITPPLSYACLELPSLKKPTMELHRFGTSDQHLDIAFPISNGRSLLLSFDTKLAHQWLNDIKSGDSYIRLQQQIEANTPLIFGQTGNHRLAGAQGSTIKPITATQFQVAVSLPEVEFLTQTERILYFANFGVALLLIALTLAATLITVRLVLKKDLRTVGSLIKRSPINMHHILPIKLAELRGCADEIKRQLGIDQDDISSLVTESSNHQDNQISPPFKTDIVVDVEPIATPDSKPTNETK